MLHRKIIDAGVPLIIGYTVVPFLLITLSKYLFSRTVIAEYLIGMICLHFVAQLSEKRRCDFLKINFNSKDFYKLRLAENVTRSIPFLLMLLYNRAYLSASVIQFIVVLLSIFQFNRSFYFTLPTPFGKRLFEYTVGFRRTFFIFPAVPFFTIMAVLAGNFNLGIFALLLLLIICLSFYTKAENEIYVWNFNSTPQKFLRNKFESSIKNFTLLSTPFLLTLIIFFFREVDVLLITIIFCYTCLVTIVLAKYSAYPKEMDIHLWILISFSIVFPPLMVIILPYFYRQSVKKLSILLND